MISCGFFFAGELVFIIAILLMGAIMRGNGEPLGIVFIGGALMIIGVVIKFGCPL